ncbi:AMP-binding protein [Microbacterium sp. A84]|uniref:AMP-binding protein n=1 Tax=Microbacterium sp. A84 TaxID=3450715 RepID=UPI003F4395BB
MTDLPRSHPEVLRRGAEIYADRLALCEGAVRLTFVELLRDAEQIARALHAHGIRPGDRVGIWAPNSHWWVRFSQGVYMLGAVVVPINTRYRAAEARELLQRTDAKAVLIEDGFLEFNYLSALADGLPEHQEEHDLRSLSLVIDVSTRTQDLGDVDFTVAGWNDFVARADEVPREAIDDIVATLGPDVLSDILFTSGTTGRSKGVRFARGVIELYWNFGRIWGLRAGDRYLVSLPMFHAGGNKAGILQCLLHGVTIIPLAVFDPVEMMQLIERERATVLNGPPTVYYALLDHPDREKFDLSSLRVAATGAAVVPMAMVERVHDELPFEHFITAYGMTECYGSATLCRQDDSHETIASTNGRPLPGVKIKIVDLDGHEVRPNESGEVLIQGPNVTPGYWDTPEQTADAIRDGWLYTGDVGALDEAGNLKITDRLKDMFFVGGFNVSPAEIEQTLSRHPHVAEVSVIGVPDERLGEVARAYVIPAHGVTPSEAEIIAWCRERMANFKVPRSVMITEELPRNAQGKVLRRVLRDIAGDLTG